MDDLLIMFLQDPGDHQGEVWSQRGHDLALRAPGERTFCELECWVIVTVNVVLELVYIVTIL